MRLKAHKVVQQVFCLLSLFPCNFDDQLSANFHMFVILYVFWDTPRENTGRWHLPRTWSHTGIASMVVLWFRRLLALECVRSWVRVPPKLAVKLAVSINRKFWANMPYDLGCSLTLLEMSDYIRNEWQMTLQFLRLGIRNLPIVDQFPQPCQCCR